MQHRLTKSLKHLLIEELQAFWATHPRFQELQVQGKFSFEERPNQAVIVKVGSGSRVDLSADNYIGLEESHAYLAKAPPNPGTSIEWVEGQQYQGETPPGLYYCEMLEGNKLTMDYMKVFDQETVMMLDDSHGRLTAPPLEGSLRLYVQPMDYPLVLGQDFTLDAATGDVALAEPLRAGESIQADYRSPAGTIGTWDVYQDTIRTDILPGLVIGFGDRLNVGDIQVIRVTAKREPCSLVYGGQWDLSVDLDLISHSLEDLESMVDLMSIFLWGSLRAKWSGTGFEIQDLSMGGESEEVRDETGDDYMFMSSMSMVVASEWRLFVPLTVTLAKVHDIDESGLCLLHQLNALGLAPANTPSA